MNTKNPNPDNRSTGAKVVTIIGLFGIIIFLAWSAIQIVKLFPSAINSLASLADSVYSYKPNTQNDKITINADRSIMNNGETIAVWWDNKDDSGSYTFSYTCQDGVAVDIRSAGKDFTSISCDNTVDLGFTDRVEVKVDSEKKRFTEVSYTIAYFKNNTEEALKAETKTISVINTDIAENTEETSTVATSTTPTPAEDKPADNIPTKPKKPVVTKPTPTEPTYIYEIPISNPNGHTDLLVSNLKVGTKSRTGAFINTDRIVKNQEGAIEFVVHNIGNKTSETWTFTAKLPGDVDYTSSKQLPLKPNERATIIVSFPATKNIDLQKISVLIKTDSDKNKDNNYVNKTVIVVQ